MTLQEIIDLLNQQNSGTSSSPAAAASVPSSTIGNPSSAGVNLSSLGGSLGGLAGGSLGGLAGGALGGNPGSNSAAIGNEVGGIAGIGSGILGTLLGGSLLGPLGAIAGPFLGDLIGSLIGGGVPREAKTQAIGGALTSSGNPLADLVGKFVNLGAGNGDVLSQSGSNTFGNSTQGLSTFLQALTGQQIPSVTGTGSNFTKDPTFTPPGLGNSAHFQLPAGYNFLNQSEAPLAASDIEKLIGLQAPDSSKVFNQDWQKVVQQLISQGALTRYQGSLGAPGPGSGGNTAGSTPGGATTTVALPHPLAQQQAVQSPYPLTAGA